MAINETIVTGRKFRKLIDEATKLWQRISFWGVATDVEFDDGENAETKFGAISGITDSLTSTSSNVAASAAAVKALNDKIVELNSDLGSVYYLGTGSSFDLKAKFPDKYQNFTVDNFIISVVGGGYLGQASGQGVHQGGESYFCGRVNLYGMSYNYEPITGTLTITPPSAKVGIAPTEDYGKENPNWWGWIGNKSYTTSVYLTIGNIIIV